MNPLVPNVNNLLAVLTILAQVLIVLLVIIKVVSRGEGRVLDFVRDNSLGIALVVALVATLGSLFYSDVAGYTPCKLCWYQRILMYPQVILLGIAWWKEDWGIKKYIVPMSVLGWLIAGFHYYEQITPKQLTSCSTAGFTASCSENFVMNFGYITIPMMAFSAFLLITVLMVMKKPERADGSTR